MIDAMLYAILYHTSPQVFPHEFLILKYGMPEGRAGVGEGVGPGVGIGVGIGRIGSLP